MKRSLSSSRLARSPTAGSPWGKFPHGFSCSSPWTDGVSNVLFFHSWSEVAQQLRRTINPSRLRVRKKDERWRPQDETNPRMGHLLRDTSLGWCAQMHTYAETCRRDENTALDSLLTVVDGSGQVCTQASDMAAGCQRDEVRRGGVSFDKGKSWNNVARNMGRRAPGQPRY